MKITKTSSGKKEIRIYYSEWKSIGKKAGWTKNLKLFRLTQTDFESILNRLQEEIDIENSRGEEYYISIEPGQGETYNSGKPTLYFYGTYEDSSVLAGRERRKWVDSFETEQEAQVFIEKAKERGININFQNVSGYVHDELLDLPDEDGNIDPNYIGPTSLDVRDPIRDSKL